MIPSIINRFNLPIRKILIERNLNPEELVSSLELGNKPAVISDVNTHNIIKISADNEIVLPKEVKPSEKYVSLLHEKTKDCDFLIAVGSGTINDLCKYTSFLDKKPYVVFGTAPSMNGYTSANASISVNGYKKTLAAHLPEAVFLDLDIMENAPERLVRSGVGDSICRSTAQTDWLLSHLLLGTPYSSEPFEILKHHEEILYNNPKDIKALCNLLILSGIGMYISGGSYPASQGEHMIAHYMDMAGYTGTYHGEQIGVTTLEMAKIQEHCLKQEKITISKTDYLAITKRFGKKISQIAKEETKNKKINTLSIDWHDIRKEIKKITVPHEKLKNTLLSINAPVTCKELKWSEDVYQEAINNAHLLRNRFTFLNLSSFSCLSLKQSY